MKVIKTSIGFILMAVLSLCTTLFSSCKNETVSEIDMQSTYKAFQNYAYSNNAFFDAMESRYASNENLSQIIWFSKTSQWNAKFEDIIYQLKLLSEDLALTGMTSETITKTANSINISNVKDDYTSTILVEVSDDYKAQRITLVEGSSVSIYEFVCTGEESYNSQFIIKIEGKYMIYQMKFSGVAGVISILIQQVNYNSIFADGTTENFASGSDAAYYFN